MNYVDQISYQKKLELSTSCKSLSEWSLKTFESFVAVALILKLWIYDYYTKVIR